MSLARARTTTTPAAGADVFAIVAIAALIPVLPLFMGGRAPFIPAYLADALLVSAMAIALAAAPDRLRRTGARERRLWLGAACVFTFYTLLQILPLPALARALGPYPAELWRFPQLAPITWSPNPAATLLGWSVFMALWSAALAVRCAPRTALGWLVPAIAGSAVFQALYGLLAHASGSTHILGLWERPAPEYLSGTFTHRNLYTAYLALTAPMAICGWWLRGVPGSSRLPRALRMAATVFCALVVSIALLGSGSRLGTVAGAATLALTGWLWLRLPSRGSWPQRWYVLGLTVVVMAGLLWFGPVELFERFLQFGLDSSRWRVWQLMVIDLPLRHWLAGTGLGSFEAVFRSVQDISVLGWYYDAHNDLLQWLLETGIVGAFVLALTLAAVWRRRWLSPLRAPVYGGLVGICIAGLGDFSWHLPGTQLVIAVYAGLLLRTSADGNAGR